ncbi:MAG: hypothetical protein Q9172_002145 [Xanthocarpia lactea]
MDLNHSSSDPKTQIMNQIRQEAAVNNARALINKLNGHCFDKCIPSPGSSLSSREQSCLSSCMEKYMGTWNTVSRVYIAQIQKTASVQAGAPGLDELGV